MAWKCGEWAEKSIDWMNAFPEFFDTVKGNTSFFGLSEASWWLWRSKEAIWKLYQSTKKFVSLSVSSVFVWLCVGGNQQIIYSFFSQYLLPVSAISGWNIYKPNETLIESGFFFFIWDSYLKTTLPKDVPLIWLLHHIFELEIRGFMIALVKEWLWTHIFLLSIPMGGHSSFFNFIHFVIKYTVYLFIYLV